MPFGASTGTAGGIMRDNYGGPPTALRPRAPGPGLAAPPAIGGFGGARRMGAKRPMSHAQIAAMKERDRGR